MDPVLCLVHSNVLTAHRLWRTPVPLLLLPGEAKAKVANYVTVNE